MLYGYPEAVQVVPGITRSRYLAVTLRTCLAANRDAHERIPYPNNYQSLPAPLKARIKGLIAMLMGGEGLRYAWRQDSEKRFQRMVKGVQQTWKSGDEPNYLNYYRCLAPVVAQHQSGNCAEYTSLVVNMMLNRGVTADRIKLLKGALGIGNNHICVVVDAAGGASAAEVASYGDSAVVCDPWLDLVASPVEFFRILTTIGCDFKPTGLRALNDDVRH